MLSYCDLSCCSKRLLSCLVRASNSRCRLSWSPMARGDSGREPLPEAGGSGNKLAAPAKLATLSLGGPWVRTEKLASPSPICCWAASISLPFFIDDCRPVPVRRPACSAGVYVAEPSPSPPAAGSETERWMSPSATASSGGVRGGGGGGGGAASWGRETAALARLRACLLGELISSLGSEGAEASRRPNGPSTMHSTAVAWAWANSKVAGRVLYESAH